MAGARINLLDPEVRRDPFPIYRQMRLTAPAQQIDPGGIWALSRYADVSHALHDPQTYSSAGFRAALAPEWLGDDRLAGMLIALDPPEHTRMRGVLQNLFGRDLINRLEHPLRAYLSALLSDLSDAAEVDAVAQIAGPIAASVVCMVLDLDTSQHRRFKHWIDAVGSVTPIEPDAKTAQTIRDAIEEEHRFFYGIVAERRRHPDGGIISTLLEASVDGRPLRDDEIVCFLCLLLGAGIDTTVHLLSKALLFLSTHPELYRALRTTKPLIPEFIEEMLRFDPPTHGLLRVTTRDVQLEHTTIPAHSLVLLLLASANRDPERYERPDDFVLGRKVKGSMAFGHGAHNCIGAALARFEGRLALELITDTFSAIERDVAQPVSWDMALHTRGPTALPMRFRRAPATVTQAPAEERRA